MATKKQAAKIGGLVKKGVPKGVAHKIAGTKPPRKGK